MLIHAPNMVLPLQPQHASQQYEGTYDLMSITPAAGRATWCDAATCGLRMISVGFDTQTLSRRVAYAQAIHVGYLFT